MLGFKSTLRTVLSVGLQILEKRCSKWVSSTIIIYIYNIYIFIHHISSYHIQILSRLCRKKGWWGYIQKVIYPHQHVVSFFVGRTLWIQDFGPLQPQSSEQNLSHDRRCKRRQTKKVMDGWTFQLKGEGKWKSFRKVGLFWMKCLFRKKHLNMRIYIYILLYIIIFIKGAAAGVFGRAVIQGFRGFW